MSKQKVESMPEPHPVLGIPYTPTVESDEMIAAASRPISISDIFVDPAARTRGNGSGPSPDDVARMAKSLELSGQLQPIAVSAPWSDAAIASGLPYQLNLGETRLQAAKSLGWTVISAIVSPHQLTADEAGARGLVENIVRTDLDPWAKVTEIHRYMTAHKATLAQMGELLHIDPSTIGSMVRLLKLKWVTGSPAIQKLIAGGELAYSAVNLISRLPADHQAQFAADLESGKLSPAMAAAKAVKTRAQLAESVGDGNAEAAPVKRTKQLRVPAILSDLGSLIPQAPEPDADGNAMEPVWNVAGTVGYYVTQYIQGKLTVKKLVGELETYLTYTPTNTTPGEPAKPAKPAKSAKSGDGSSGGKKRGKKKEAGEQPAEGSSAE